MPSLPTPRYTYVMRSRLTFVLLPLLLAALTVRADYREFKDLPLDPSIQSKLQHAADDVLKQFPKLTPDNFAMTVVDLSMPSAIGRGDYHGDAPFYPASVVKLFFMAEIYHQHLETMPDVDRALHEMIGVSDNDATAFILDVISDTCSGPMLEGRALRRFLDKRAVA